VKVNFSSIKFLANIPFLQGVKIQMYPNHVVHALNGMVEQKIRKGMYFLKIRAKVTSIFQKNEGRFKITVDLDSI
jgi:hypothetical protein